MPSRGGGKTKFRSPYKTVGVTRSYKAGKRSRDLICSLSSETVEEMMPMNIRLCVKSYLEPTDHEQDPKLLDVERYRVLLGITGGSCSYHFLEDKPCSPDVAVVETTATSIANRSVAALADGFIERFERHHLHSVLETPLADCAAGKNAISMDGEYKRLSEGRAGEGEIACKTIAGTNSGVI